MNILGYQSAPLEENGTQRDLIGIGHPTKTLTLG